MNGVASLSHRLSPEHEDGAQQDRAAAAAFGAHHTF